MKRFLPVCLLATLFAMIVGAPAALAQPDTTAQQAPATPDRLTALGTAPGPVGTWRTIDDRTGDPRSIVEVYEEDGQLYGRVAEILKVSDKAERNSEGQVICTACNGARENQPVEGMIIIEGLRKDGEEWTGGTILNPENGKTYKATMEMKSEDRLEVRGYIGVPLFGRSQTWERVTS